MVRLDSNKISEIPFSNFYRFTKRTPITEICRFHPAQNVGFHRNLTFRPQKSENFLSNFREIRFWSEKSNFLRQRRALPRKIHFRPRKSKFSGQNPKTKF